MKPVEGPLLLFTLMLSAVTLSGCGDKMNASLSGDANQAAVLPPSADVSGMTSKRNIRTGSWRK